MNSKERNMVQRMTVFIGLFYGRYFLESPLTASAPKNHLNFYFFIKQFQSIDDELTSAVLKSVERHLDYLSEENIVLSLFDESLTDEDRSLIGQKLISTPRPSSFPFGKLILPTMSWTEKPHLSTFIGFQSWLIFHQLKLHGKQEWLNVPPAYWNTFEDFNIAKSFVSSLVTVNDPAERGIKLITDFKESCKDQENREYLAQVVKHHRQLCPSKNLTKDVIGKA